MLLIVQVNGKLLKDLDNNQRIHRKYKLKCLDLQKIFISRHCHFKFFFRLQIVIIIKLIQVIISQFRIFLNQHLYLPLLYNLLTLRPKYAMLSHKSINVISVLANTLFCGFALKNSHYHYIKYEVIFQKNFFSFLPLLDLNLMPTEGVGLQNYYAINLHLSLCTSKSIFTSKHIFLQLIAVSPLTS